MLSLMPLHIRCLPLRYAIHCLFFADADIAVTLSFADFLLFLCLFIFRLLRYRYSVFLYDSARR